MADFTLQVSTCGLYRGTISCSWLSFTTVSFSLNAACFRLFYMGLSSLSCLFERKFSPIFLHLSTELHHYTCRLYTCHRYTCCHLYKSLYWDSIPLRESFINTMHYSNNAAHNNQHFSHGLMNLHSGANFTCSIWKVLHVWS